MNLTLAPSLAFIPLYIFCDGMGIYVLERKLLASTNVATIENVI